MRKRLKAVVAGLTSAALMFGAGGMLPEGVWDGLVVKAAAKEVVKSGTCGPTLNWSLDDEGTLEITGTGYMYDYTASTHAPWYPYRDDIVELDISYDAASIGNYAFYECKNIKRGYIGNITSIGDYAFSGCESFVTQLPSDLQTLGKGAFQKCSSLKDIVIPKSITTIKEYTFDGCSGATTLSLPSTLTMIEDKAFRGCAGLTVIKLPDKVTDIGEGAFAGCTALVSVELDNRLEYIGDDAFNGCSSLTYIFIPRSVSVIGDTVFEGCSSLTEIYVAGLNEFYDSDNGILFDKDHLNLICYPAAIESESYTVPEGVLTIDDSAFYECVYLNSISFPQSLRSIGSYAFSKCSELTGIDIPYRVTVIKDGTFGYCTNLTSITLPQNLVSIQDSAFAFCRELESITIPDNVRVIEDYVFAETNLKSFTFPTRLTALGNGVFSGCLYLRSITIPDNIESIGYEMFWRCSNLSSITLPDGIKEIGFCAFGDCPNLGSIILPASIEKIDYSAFSGCESLTEINYKGSEEQWNSIDGLADACIPEGCTINYNYYEVMVTGLAVVAPNPAPVFYVGDNFDPTGYKLEVTCNDGVVVNIDLTDDMISGDKTNMQQSGTLTVTFEDVTTTFDVTVAAKKNISSCTIAAIADQTYTGSAIKPSITVKDGSKTLIKGTDYRVSYSKNTDIGTATIKVVGYGDYTGTTTVTFNIVAAAKNISNCTISAIADQTYTGSAIKPAITVKDGSKTLVKGTDYKVSYSNNTNIGTATIKVVGYGDYTGTKTVTFKIVDATAVKSIGNCTISAIAAQTYTGSAIKPAITVKDGSKVLTKGTDYKVAYSNNTNIGTATIKVVGYGDYTGTKTVTFNIVAVAKKISNCTISAIADQTYTGSAIKPVIIVKDGDKKLVKGTDYRVSYSNNINIGTATIKVVGYGDYTGSRTVTFVIK